MVPNNEGCEVLAAEVHLQASSAVPSFQLCACRRDDRAGCLVQRKSE